MGKNINKKFYHLKCIEIDNSNSIRYFKTLKECGNYYNCSDRLLSYKLKKDNENKIGKLYNISIYKCKEPVIYEEKRIDIIN
tara:strand:+ start:249 stop:494 length:246 start_codon:yes stop_codon:yes gene_type:complete